MAYRSGGSAVNPSKAVLHASLVALLIGVTIGAHCLPPRGAGARTDNPFSSGFSSCIESSVVRNSVATSMADQGAPIDILVADSSVFPECGNPARTDPIALDRYGGEPAIFILIEHYLI